MNPHIPPPVSTRRTIAAAVAASLAVAIAPVAVLADAPVAAAAPHAPGAPGEPGGPGTSGAAVLVAQPTAEPVPNEEAQPMGDPSATSEEEEPSGPAPGRRDTAGCEFRENTPPAVNTSEVPAPGAPTPTPLPVPEHPAGGPRMAECDVVANGDFEVPEDVAASSWLVFDTVTGEVVAAKDPHGRYRPASIIKVLVALVALDELDLAQEIPVTEEDAGIEGSRAGLVGGKDYTVETLLLGLIMSSGNDCASALTRALGGDEEVLRKVNEKARELGATDTRVSTTSGLDGPGQSTSAFDMGLFYAEAFNDPVYRRLSSTRLHDMPGDEEREIEGFTMSNDNQLLASGFEGALGGKTGFTDLSRHTFVGVAERDGRRLGAIVLDTTVEEGHRAWQQAAMLLESGFKTQPGPGVGNLSIAASGAGAGELGAEDMEGEILDALGVDPGPTVKELGWVLGIAGLGVALVGWWAIRRTNRHG